MTDTYHSYRDPQAPSPADPFDPYNEPDPAADRSLVDDVKALVQDGKLMAEAELDFQKKRAAYGAGAAGGIGARFAVAGVLALLAGIGFTVGLIIALADIITIWGSTVLVTLALLLGAFLMVRAGQKRLNHVKSVISTQKRGDG